jgi:hypothetical protein
MSSPSDSAVPILIIGSLHVLRDPINIDSIKRPNDTIFYIRLIRNVLLMVKRCIRLGLDFVSSVIDHIPFISGSIPGYTHRFLVLEAVKEEFSKPQFRGAGLHRVHAVDLNCASYNACLCPELGKETYW